MFRLPLKKNNSTFVEYNYLFYVCRTSIQMPFYAAIKIRRRINEYYLEAKKSFYERSARSTPGT